ncbi:hypothetical protein D3C81_1462620 [compost metagenome]
MITLAVLDAAWGCLFGPVAGVGDTRFGHRVSQQEFRWLGVETVLTHQAFEHGRHRTRVIPGLFQIEDADAVGFLFVLPGEGALRLNRRCLRTGDGRNTGVTATGCGNDDPGQQRGHHRYLHSLRCLDAAREVAL